MPTGTGASMTSTTGRVAVVTGAGSGIGRALALELARRGCRLAISDIDPERLASTVADCEDRGARVLAGTVDVSDRAAVDAHSEAVARRFGGAHLVFNNAGIAYVGPATTQSPEDVQRVLDVNLWGVIHGTQAFLPQLIASGDGHLVNISSLFGLMTVPSHSAYCASKFAVRGYTEAVATEMAAARRPVRVSCVHPGGIDTNIAGDAAIGDGYDHDELQDLFGQVARTSADDAARAILRGVERDHGRILVGPDAKALHTLIRLLGGRYPSVVGAVTRRASAISRPLPR